MYTQSNRLVDITRAKASRHKRTKTIDGRTRASSLRGSAPSLRVFKKATSKFVDQYGRVYILPTQGDETVERLVDMGQVRGAYDPDDDKNAARGGFAYDARRRPSAPRLDGSGGLFMYVLRPRNVDKAAVNTTPDVFGSRTREELVLSECNDDFATVPNGSTYKARVQQTATKRGSARGHVVLSNVLQTNAPPS